MIKLYKMRRYSTRDRILGWAHFVIWQRRWQERLEKNR